MANITGTNNNDTLKDTSGSDNIQGLGGDDTIIVSKGGGDAVDGGGGTDTLVVDWSALTNAVRGAGSFFTNDVDFTVNYAGIEKIDITTGRGNDDFATGAGDDTVSSGAGDDSFNTGKGKAVVDGGSGKDLWAADFSDLTKAVVLDIALAGTQTFVGGSETGVERLAFTTGAGADRILTLTGSAGAGLADNISSGAGADVIRIGGGNDVVDGGDGVDTLIVDYGATGKTVRGQGSFLTNDADLTVNFTGIEQLDVTTGKGDDNFSTLDGDDTISAGLGDDSFNTGKGDAAIDGGAGKDLWGTDFSDRTEAMVLDIGLAGKQSFAGGSEINVERLSFVTGSGDDSILTLTGAAGAGLADNISTGAGSDTIRVGGGSDLVDGGAGTDTLIVDYGATATNIRAAASFFTDDVSITVNHVGIEQFVVITGSGDDQLVTLDGDDTIRSGAGNDSFNTGKGHGQVDGGAGKDLWIADFSDMGQAMVLDIGLAGKQSFAGGSEINVERLAFTTGSGADRILTLTGPAGTGLGDTISSGAGADVIGVGGGADNVDGGQGKDTLIIDYSDAVIHIRSAGSFYTDDVSRTVNFSNIEQFVVAGGAVGDELNTGDGRDTVAGGGGDDSINTAKDKAEVDGGTGNDLWAADFSDQKKAMVLDLAQSGTQAFAGGSETSVERVSFTTGAGDDSILTLAGPAGAGLADNVSTGAGSDTIRVGGGSDVVDGGAGAGIDTLIIDYHDAVIRIRSAGSFYTDDVSRTVNFGNIERFDVSTGSANDDILTGNGDDTVSAGAGDDHFETLKGMATIDGGAGADTWGANFSDNAQAVVLDLAIGGNQVFAGGKVRGVEAVDFTLGGLNDAVTTLIGSDSSGGSTNCYNDAIRGGGGDDVITVGGGSDVVDGGDGFDRLIVDYSGSAFTVRTGGSFVTNDRNMTVNYSNVEQVDLILTHGADKARAGAGADMLDGGAGRDVLWGGAGRDSFRFSALGDSGVGAEDRIRDFIDGVDRIDLSLLDARAGAPGDQAFAFIGTQAFHHVAGELRYERVGQHTMVSGDVDGDGAADFAIRLDGVHALDASSFVL